MIGDVSIGKYLSYVLRHRPDVVGLDLHPGGWVEVEALLRGLAEAGRPLDRADLERIVAADDKGRFSFGESGLRIRANQGHSVPIDLELEPRQPPPRLFHGTVRRFLPSIRASGLQPRNRHAVHLSADVATATTVGSRRGRPAVLVVDAAGMSAEGHVFHRSDNGVWLTAEVPSRFLSFPDE